MNFLTIFIALMALSISLLFSQADISHEIAKLKHADESQRYIIMNRIKQQLAGMNAKQRAAAIAQLRGGTHSARHTAQSRTTNRGSHQHASSNGTANGMMKSTTGHRGSGGSHGAPQIPAPATPSLPQGGHITSPSHSNPAAPPHAGPQTPGHTPPHTGPQAPPSTGPQTPPHTGPQAPPSTGPQAPPHTGPHIPGPRPGQY